MIKFFRKIRKNLLTENKISKYLIYAIGEIVLVVIGILIALQINNWNEGKKLRKSEIKVLEALREGFKADSLDLNINAIALTFASKSGNLILDKLNSSAPYHDSLSIHFSLSLAMTRLISNDGPYDVLKSKGLDLISNDSLRQQIINMHDHNYEALRTWESGFFVSDRYIQEQCLDLFNVVQYFDMDTTGIIAARMIPHDYEALQKNKRYKTMIQTYSSQSGLFLKRTLKVQSELNSLLANIDWELKKLAALD